MRHSGIGARFAVLLGVAASCGCGTQAAGAAEPPSAVVGFLGRWDVALLAPDHPYASWLEISDPAGAVQVRMVGRWGHARLLPQASVQGDTIRFVSPKEDEGRSDSDMIFEAHLVDGALEGSTTGPDGAPWTWRAVRAPELKRAAPPHWGRPVVLFDGHDLRAWRESAGTGAAHWEVRDGTLLSPGSGPDLQSITRFNDFQLHVEFKCPAGANSGVYLRGRYELQIEEGVPPQPLEQRLGSIYGFIAPSPAAPRRPDRWRSYDITLVGRRLTVKLDQQLIIDQREIPGPTGGALDSDEGSPGPIYLQGSEPGRVAYRRIVLTPASAAP